MTDGPDEAHADLDTLADLEAGTLPDATAAEIRGHVDRCPSCGARLTEIRTTRALLSALPAESMPAAVRARIDSTLQHAGPVAPTVVPLAARRRWWRSPAVAGVAAALAVGVLVAGVIVGNRISHHHRVSAGRPPTATAGTNGANALVRIAAIREWNTGTDYAPGTIRTLVPRLLGTPPPVQTFGANSGAAGPAESPSPTSYSRAAGITFAELRASRAAVAECGHILADDQTTVPLAIDFARYLGKPAVVVVLPAVGHPSDVDVFVLRGPCSSSALFPYFRVPRAG